MRCADSDISICKRQVLPFWIARVRGFCWFGAPLGVLRHPMPRMRPMVISGHGSLRCGHVRWARSHMMRLALVAQRVSM